MSLPSLPTLAHLSRTVAINLSLAVLTAAAASVARSSSTIGRGSGEATSRMPGSQPQDPTRDRYRSVLILLSGATLAGTAGAVIAGQLLANAVLYAAAVTLGLSFCTLTAVLILQIARAKAPLDNPVSSHLPETKTEATPETPLPSQEERWKVIERVREFGVRIVERFRLLGATGAIRFATAILGALSIIYILRLDLFPAFVSPPMAALLTAGCLLAAGLAATTAHYLGSVEPARLPEAPWLRRGARVVAWILALAAVSIDLVWARQLTLLRVLEYLILTINAAICYGLFTARRPQDEVVEGFPLNLGVLSVLGSRANVLASVLLTAEQQLGIDLRSTWALTVVRSSLEPLAIGLLFTGWLSTSLTVVGLEEQGLVERLGVPVQGQPLQPGIHLHWPWPIDRVFRLPVQRMQTATVGHEGEESGGPENVLWARQHAINEYTLLLGNGRDLITIDAAVQYRI